MPRKNKIHFRGCINALEIHFRFFVSGAASNLDFPGRPGYADAQGGRSMNLSIINTVLTVSRCKSFMEASYALNYTPAVVSKHIARAEEELGVRLFLRGNKANSITRTPECEAVIGDLEQIMSSWERVETTLELLRTDARKSTVRIGTPRRAWNYGSDEIIAGFYRHSPELSVDMTYAHTEELLRLLSLGKLDGVFLFVQGKAGDYEFLERFRREQECEFFFIEEIRQMYLAISDRLPLARKDEASFAEFRDFTIAFNSDRLAISAGRNMIPFLNLAAKYGFPLRHKALPTLDASVYRLADAHVQRYIDRGFTHLQFAFGCTGGQHRSVYSAQHLAEHIHRLFPAVQVHLCHREQGIVREYGGTEVRGCGGTGVRG